MKVKTTLFITTILLAGLLFLPLATNIAHAGAPPMPKTLPGCCTTQLEGGQCVACPEGETCQTSLDFCEFEDGVFQKGACSEVEGSASCENKIIDSGCCVVQPGSCVDEVSSNTCFFEVSASSETWVSGASCSVVPECTITKNIPTMSNWGLIALAGVFVLAGIWAITRKKAEA